MASEVVGSGQDQQTAAVNQHLTRLIDGLEQATSSMRNLREQDSDRGHRHRYVEAVRLAGTVRELGEMYCDLLAFTANQRPGKASIPQLADASGLSINTLRARLPNIRQGGTRDDDDGAPF